MRVPRGRLRLVILEVDCEISKHWGNLPREAYVSRRVAVTAVLVVVLSLVGTAFADSLDFNIAGPASGSISYNGSGGPLVGSGISLE
jgi:hypothetical protein